MYSTVVGEVLYRYQLCPADRWCYWVQLCPYWFSACWICPHQIEEYWKFPTVTVHSFISSCSSRGLYHVCFGAMHSKSLQSCWLCKPLNYSPPASLSMGFSRQEYWSGLLCPSSTNALLLGTYTLRIALFSWKTVSIFIMQCLFLCPIISLAL